MIGPGITQATAAVGLGLERAIGIRTGVEGIVVGIVGIGRIVEGIVVGIAGIGVGV